MIRAAPRGQHALDRTTLLVAFSVTVAFTTTAAAAQNAGEPAFEPRHAEFLDLAEILLSDLEREVFEELRHPHQRDAFVKRFWEVRDPFPETPQNEFRERFDHAVEIAEKRLGGEHGARFEALLLYGEPQRTIRVACGLLRPLDIWHYPQSAAVRGEFYLIFVRQGGIHRPWTPADGLSGLLGPGQTTALDRRSRIEAIGRQCAEGGDVLAAFSLALDWEAMADAAGPPGRASDEWARSFLDRSTEIPSGAEALAAEVSMRYPGRRGSRTVVQAIVGIDPGLLPKPGDETWRFVLDGEVLRDDELFETFRYRFDQPVRRGGDGALLPLVAERYLRPGPYRLAIKVRELGTNRFFQGRAEVEVPVAEAAGAAGNAGATDAEPAAGIPEWLLEANALSPRDAESNVHLVRLHPLPERLLTGRLRIRADAEGPGIHHVAFSLDDRELVSKRRPPYHVEIDLGAAPRVRSLRADAYDERGRLLATDELAVNSGPHRFTIRLIEPQRGASYVTTVRAAAEVQTPRHERLDRVEFFLNDTRTATLYQPPFEQPIPIDPGEPLSYVRVVAHLEGGAWAEDVVFVNSSQLLEEVEVALVELYLSVTERSGAPVEELGAEDFDVRVDGSPVALERFDRAANQPVHAGILFDTSISMENRLDAAEEAALHFFELVLGPDDRACLITFNDRPDLVVGFTNSPETLAGGLSGLAAEGETALYDSILYALYYFGGLRGKRALILLTDGEDSASQHGFDEVLDFARRSQVAIYSIGIDIDPREYRYRSRLQQLCNETGGRCFFVSGASELKRVYERIETEVRSQYLLVFESPEAEAGAYHEVDVQLRGGARGRGRRGVTIRTIPGYFQ